MVTRTMPSPNQKKEPSLQDTSAAPQGRALAAGIMDWDKLRIFHAVAEAGSFTHAGELLNLSQSAVSRQVSALEGSLNVSLFHRHARGLILTEQGDGLPSPRCRARGAAWPSSRSKGSCTHLGAGCEALR